VVVNSGEHKSKSGRVLQVIQDLRVPQVVVQGINLVSSRRALGNNAIEPLKTSCSDNYNRGRRRSLRGPGRMTSLW
jgi:ribosomal protein L24